MNIPNKRYFVQRVEDTVYKHAEQSNIRRSRIFMWDSINKVEVNFPPYPYKEVPIYQDLMSFFNDYCQEMNDKHDDDLLYLNEVNDYTTPNE